MKQRLLLRAGQLRPIAVHRAPPMGLLLGRKPNMVPRRTLLGPIFRIAKSTVGAAAGATVGGAAYVNYKLGEAGATVSDKLNQAQGWLSGVYDSVSERLGNGANVVEKAVEDANQAGANGEHNVDFSAGSGGSSGSGGSGGSGSGGSGSTGGSGGGQGGGFGDAGLGAAAVAALSADDDDTMVHLTRKMIDIRNILLEVDDKDSLLLPSIVVIGSQSSGKSSVLEAIVGHEFLPKGGNMVTRRPIELTLVHSPDVAAEYCEFPALKLGKITDFTSVQRTLTELNQAVPADEVVSDDPIQLNVYSPNVPDLTMIDLPGYIQVVAADQPPTLKRKIADLCDKYIQEPNVILAISAADVDLANSTALRASRRVDPRGERTIGVITKMDLVSPERGYELLTNREYPLEMGYVGVVTRMPGFGFHRQLTQSIAKNEKQYFGAIPEYKTLATGVLTLRSKLMNVLSTSMAHSLAPTTAAIRRELEECSYRFKVEYNDRVLTPQTYLAQSLDTFKMQFKELTSQFGREQVKQLVRGALDQKVLDTLAESYWNAPPELEAQGVVDAVPLANMSSNRPDMFIWQPKLDSASAALTKLGVGRLSAQLLEDAIGNQINGLAERSPFQNHPLAIQTIEEATHRLLDTRVYSTADQVENSIKPYKYEVEVDDREWAASRDHSYNLLKEELRQAQTSYDRLKTMVGSQKLSQAVKYVENRQQALVKGQPPPTADQFGFSQALLHKGSEAAFLKQRCDILRMRMAAIKSSKCRSKTNKYQCPEVFLDVVADKLTATAVLFLNFELLSDFYYSFPRELDAKLAQLSDSQVQLLATQDPKIKRHVDLQRRKELLQLALAKINAVTEMYNHERRS